MSYANYSEVKGLPKTFADLPEDIVLGKTGETVELDIFREELDYKYVYDIFAEIIESGQCYPRDTFNDDIYRGYYLSFNPFVIRLSATKQTIACFYIKPTFGPGRASHVASFGLAASSAFRGRGLGYLMVEKVIKYAKMLGYEALYTTMVFVTNTASVKAIKAHGFTEVGRLPRAGNLKGLGFTDALQMYLNLKDN